MSLHNTTPVPNELFEHIPHLTHAELRVLLLVIRQTYGWIDTRTGNRKLKDRMNYTYIIQKTGLYRTILSKTIQQLVDKNLLIVSDTHGNQLVTPQSRSGHQFLFFQFRPVRNFDTTYSHLRTGPVRDYEHNKRKKNKRNTKQKKTANQHSNIQQLQTMIHHLATLKQISESSSIS